MASKPGAASWLLSPNQEWARRHCSSNFWSAWETPRAKLLQIVFAGQPQLAEKVARPELEQLRQRISLFARLEPISLEETPAYIDHRFKVAGYAGPALFTPEAMEMIATRG